MDSTFAQEFVITTLVVAVTVGITMPWMLDIVELSNTRKAYLDLNSDKKAIAWFLYLLQGVTSEVVMHDDGDTAGGSIYQNKTVVDAIERTLHKNGELQVKCLLTHRRHETLFEQRFDNHNRVFIYERTGPRSPIHYKIFDGKKAYVSRHAPQETTRKRLFIDCSQASRRGARHLALRRYFEDFEQHHAA